MTTLRCTAKLLKRLGIRDPAEPPAAANRLGDWFANILYTRQGHFILLVNERSLLPIVTTARDLDRLEERFRRLLEDVLLALEVPRGLIDRELSLMDPLYYGCTNSRVVLGSMTDFAFLFKYMLPRYPEMTPLDWSLDLARAPCRPIGMQRPDDVAPALLENPVSSKVLEGEKA